MKVLILHSSSDLYGASKILLITIQGLKKEQIECIVVLSEPGPLSQELMQMGVECIFIKLGILRRKYFNLMGLHDRARTMRKAYHSLIFLCKERDIQLIYSNTSSVLVSGFVARRLSIRHIYHIHEIIVKPKWLAWLINKHISKRSDCVVAVSKAVSEALSDYIDAKKVVTIYNGIDYDGFADQAKKEPFDFPQKSGKEILIGMIARVHPWKGQQYFLEIAAALQRDGINAKFVMVGDVFPGNEYLLEQITEKIETLELKEVVFDLGYRTDVPTILDSLDLLVLPSTAPDPFPTVILEAMAVGTAVVATNHGGALEMIEDQKSGIHIPINNANKSAKAMHKICTSESFRNQISLCGKERVRQHFTQESFVSKILTVVHG